MPISHPNQSTPRRSSRKAAPVPENFERRALFAFISYGLLLASAVVLICRSCPWLAFLVPVVYCIRDWHRSLPYSSATTRIFAPDPLSPNLASIGVEVAKAVNETKLDKSVDWLLCPFCSENAYQPYELDYSDSQNKLLLRSKGVDASYKLDIRMKFESPLPLCVTDRPLRIKISKNNGFALLSFCQQPVYSFLLLPKFIYLSLFLALLIMFHFAVAGTFLDNPVQQIILAFIALVFPVTKRQKT